MRRRLRAKYGRGGGKLTGMSWMTTAILLTAAMLWYLPSYFSTESLDCEQVMAWWFEGGPYRPELLYVSSLFAITLALWLYVDIIRPKRVRIPAGIRAGQALLVTAMVVMSVFQWGFYRPRSDEGRIYAYFRDEVSGWPVIRLFLISGLGYIAYSTMPPDDVLAGPLFEEFRALEAAYRREYLDAGVPREYGRAGARENGRLECSARHEVDAAWERAYEGYFLTLAPEAPEPTARDALTLPVRDD